MNNQTDKQKISLTLTKHLSKTQRIVRGLAVNSDNTVLYSTMIDNSSLFLLDIDSGALEGGCSRILISRKTLIF